MHLPVPTAPPHDFIMQPSSQTNRSICGDDYRPFITKFVDDDISVATPKASNIDPNKVVKMSETALQQNDEDAALQFTEIQHDAVIRGMKASLHRGDRMNVDLLLLQLTTIIEYADIESLYPFLRDLYRLEQENQSTQSTYAHDVWFEKLTIRSNGEEISDPLPPPFGGPQRRLPGSGMVAKIRRAISPQYRFKAMVDTFKKNFNSFDAVHRKSLVSILFTLTLISAWKKNGAPPPRTHLTGGGSRETERTGGKTMTDQKMDGNLNNHYRLDKIKISMDFHCFARKVTKKVIPNHVIVRSINDFLVQTPPSTA